ncbi:hypothetical protein EVAR_100861_1 [Eumeta japonica]|uniref:Uncharacterized protein n=1 Tax=Eumeta variegata TaxID=151549 RepID=A0A4C1SB78_EUMVA|nr:hypothetical protein EVAR_100861_1 [Eumeta japonica]
MEHESIPIKEPTQTASLCSPVGKFRLRFQSTGWSDISDDYSDLFQFIVGNLPAPNPNQAHFSLRRPMANWRKLSQAYVASQGAVVEKPDKAAARTAAKNNNKKKSDTDVATSPSACTACPEATTRVRIEHGGPSYAENALKRILVKENIQYSDSLETPLDLLDGYLPIEEVKDDLCSQNLPVHATYAHKDTNGPSACVLCKQKDHTANYIGCPRAPKRALPREDRAAPARAFSNTLGYARAAAGPCSVPPAAKQNQPSTADDLKQLMLIISITDINEPAVLVKNSAAVNPTEKLISLIEHALLVEAIKIISFDSIKIYLLLHSIVSR